VTDRIGAELEEDSWFGVPLYRERGVVCLDRRSPDV